MGPNRIKEMQRDVWYVRDMQDAKRGGAFRGFFYGVLLSIPLWTAAYFLWRHFS